MANIAIFRINYKSDFILTLNSDAGWMTPFCIKFWTGAPSKAYFAGYDGTTYTHCAPVAGEPTKLLVQFDDHHLPIGDLKFQIGYHFTVADFPTSVEDEVINQASVIIEQDGEPAQVMLDFNGETAPEIEFSLPAYANEAQRIANEDQRIAHEAIRIVNEESRIAAETIRQQNEAQRIQHEEYRVSEFARLKHESEAATTDANTAATLANEKAALAADKAALAQAAADLANAKAQLAADKAALAQAAADLANAKAALAQQKAEYAQTQGDYAKAQGDYAKAQGDTAQADHVRAEADHTTAADDHSRAEGDHTTAASDHSRAESDHTTAASDHSRAESDHTTAASDHSRAESDHTTAASDHTRAESDHTTAASDHETAASDHTRAESDHAAVEVYVDSLGAFDISSYHATGGELAKYADLTAALGTNGANVPESLRKGGMSVKFIQGTVQSNDNKYAEYFLTKNTWSASESDWEKMNLEEEVSQLGREVTIIDEVIDAETTSEVVSERIPYVQNVGYINSGGAISTSNQNYRYTDPILLKAGESLKMKAITGTAIARLCSYDPDTQTRTVLLMGASTSTSSAADAYENTYTATEDIYLVVCYYWQYFSLELTKTYTKVTTTSALDGVGVMEDILDIEHDTETITEDVPFTVITGKYYSGSVGQATNVNNPSTNQQYNCSSPFEVKAGETIEVKANGASSVVLFAVQDGNNYRCIAVGEGIAVTTTVQYQVIFDTLAVVSYRAADGISVKKTYTKDEYDSARIKNLEDNLGQIPVLSGQVAALDGKVTIVQNAIGSSVDDDMTEGIVEGKFINNNGAIANSASFAYKEFVVRSGAVVKLVCSGHSNCASLAKKVSETQYQVLIPGSSSSVDVTYTVTEDMTMAVSFYVSYERNIKIVTDYIEANRQSIKRLVDYNNDANIQDIDLGFLFDKIAVIGDSMSVGSIDGFPFSLGSAWLSFLAKRYGCTGKHFYAKGGTTTYGWLNDNTGYGLGSFLADETVYNCYFIAYGHNDSMSVGEITDTVAPVTITEGVPSCPSGLSFCSYYKAVIEQVRAKAPHAMILCLSSYDDVMVTKDAFRQAIKGIADQYYNGGDELVHYLDTGGVGDSELNNGGHYSTIGYAYIAKKINTELNKVIYEHRGDDALKFFGVYNL